MRVPSRPPAALAAAGMAGYTLLVRGALTLDLGIGRRVRPLGPIRIEVAAPPETLFDVIAGPYLAKTPCAMRSKLQVLERGTDLVLAAHHTPAGGLTATTVETVRFERPISSGELPALKVGGQLRIDRNELYEGLYATEEK